jgi:hypothetical protein
MDNYNYYLVLNSLVYGKQTYMKDDVLAERKDVDLSALVADGIIVDVAAYLLKIETDSAAQIAKIEAEAKTKKEFVANLVAKVTAKRITEENRVKAEEKARKEIEDAASSEFAAKVAGHLKGDITGPTTTSHE